jgi:c-di-GMP-binding flagellar brake protein YcgR
MGLDSRIIRGTNERKKNTKKLPSLQFKTITNILQNDISNFTWQKRGINFHKKEITNLYQ